MKNIFALKPKEKKQEAESSVVDYSNQSITYYEDGTKKCIDASGNPGILRHCLAEVYQNFKEKVKNKKEEQHRLKQPIIEEQVRQKSELSKRELLLDLKNAELKEIDVEINLIERKISEAPENPKKYGIDADSKPKAQFYIGLLILMPVTLYLIVFYISASYSAFFKQFSPETTIMAAIFDGQALSKALNDGWLEVVFVCTIPFAFMGLGYLIHMFQKSKDKPTLKIALLILVTFLFDAILAYQIENKIFDFESLPGEKFSLLIAVQSIKFWGIIFAGFIVYIIWGFVFDFTMHEYENIDKVKLFINSQSAEKEKYIIKKGELKKVIEDVQTEISSIKGKISELQSQIDGFIFEKKRYLVYHSQFLSGWMLAISREIAMPRDQQNLLIEECNKISEEHLQTYNLTQESSEETIYL